MLVKIVGLFAVIGLSHSAATPAPCETIAEIASGNPDFSTLLTAVEAAGLTGALANETFGPITVFAPTNQAFAKVPNATLTSLLQPRNKDQLINVLQYHIVEGEVLSRNLRNGQVVTMLNGDTTRVNLCGANRVTITGGTAKNVATVVTRDIEACNGVIHVIDTVLLPPQ